MSTSELALKKNKVLIPTLLNMLYTLLTRKGYKVKGFNLLKHFLFKLKHDQQSPGNHALITRRSSLILPLLSNNDSPILKFYNFVSKLTPRLEIIVVTNKKSGKVFKTPMPPLKKSLLRHNFIVKYITAARSKQYYGKLDNQLVQHMDSLKQKNILIKDWEDSYNVLKQHKFRAKKRHDKLIKKKKISRDVIKKDKQFYI